MDSECKYCGEIITNSYYGRVCKKCHGKLTLEVYRKGKIRAVEYKGGKCQICGYNKCAGSLQFHKDKKFNGNYVRCHSFERIKKELDKCDLLCANCHGEIHWGYGLTGNTQPLDG